MISALFLALALQVPDSMVVRVAVPTAEVEQAGDTTIVFVNVSTDSLAALLERNQLATQAEVALAEAIQARCGCTQPAVPAWAWAGLLALGTYAVYSFSKDDTDESGHFINVFVDIENPPHEHEGHGRKRKGRGHDPG